MRSLIMIIICLTTSGCALMEYQIDERAVTRASRTVNNWIAQDRPVERQKMCRTYEWKGMYGQKELRTVCQ
jgi:hypothetical protein